MPRGFVPSVCHSRCHQNWECGVLGSSFPIPLLSPPYLQHIVSRFPSSMLRSPSLASVFQNVTVLPMSRQTWTGPVCQCPTKRSGLSKAHSSPKCLCLLGFLHCVRPGGSPSPSNDPLLEFLQKNESQIPTPSTWQRCTELHLEHPNLGNNYTVDTK